MRHSEVWDAAAQICGTLTTSGSPISRRSIQSGRIGMDEMWDNLTYFLENAVPTAEKAGVQLAAHPNDPPVPEYRGVAQPLGDIEGMQRLVEVIDSPAKLHFLRHRRHDRKRCGCCRNDSLFWIAESHWNRTFPKRESGNTSILSISRPFTTTAECEYVCLRSGISRGGIQRHD